MPKFIAIRHGSNGSNQSMIQEMVVAVVIAKDAEEAQEVVEGDGITVYNNQYLELVPAKEASRAQQHEAQDAGVINAIEQGKRT